MTADYWWISSSANVHTLVNKGGNPLIRIITAGFGKWECLHYATGDEPTMLEASSLNDAKAIAFANYRMGL